MLSDPSYCLFRCGSQTLAVPVEEVAEIVETSAMVRISGCPPPITGLCPYHRQVVPVVSLAPAAETTNRTAGIDPADRLASVLILRTAQGPWGIRIDRDGTIIRTARPERHDARRNECGGEFVTVGSIRVGNVEHALLDPSNTWQAIRDRVVSWYLANGDGAAGPHRRPDESAEAAVALQRETNP